MAAYRQGDYVIFVAIFFTFMATVFTWFSAFGCSFFRIQYAFTSVLFPAGRGYGLWTIEAPAQYTVEESQATGTSIITRTIGTCQLYSSLQDSDYVQAQFDFPFILARTTSMIAMVLSVIVAISISISLFLKSIKYSFAFIQGLVMYLICIFTIIEFAALNSHLCSSRIECSMSSAGSFGIVAAVFWFLAGTTCFFISTDEDKYGNSYRQRINSSIGQQQQEQRRVSVTTGAAADSLKNQKEDEPAATIARLSMSEKQSASRASGKDEEDATSISEVTAEQDDDKLQTIPLD